ncbi:unnamed protein product [Durusdinium trenchii]|uniref:Palmitoyltransferase n=2 Tax=Durusdinium trenchii TaxID=1381693 RepID=A0ABP0N4L0_9DINO
MRSTNYGDAYGRSGPFSAYGSYGPQLGMQPPTAYHMGDVGMPTYPAGRAHDSVPLVVGQGGLPPTTILAPRRPSTQKADTESCADEGCPDENDDAEDKAGNQDLSWTFLGVNFKPLLPLALALSTVAGAICMLLFQIPLLSRATSTNEVALSAAFCVLYGITLGFMTWCSFADPGQVRKTRNLDRNAMDIEEGMPRRAHRSWQYPRPIRRYDHYCKWLNNVIGLLNHREFVLMLFGLLLIGVLGLVIDLWLAILIAQKGFMESEIIVALHLAYSVALLAIDWPICRIHLGLVSRNELAQEWKKNENYVANNTTLGDNIPVEELDDEEYNELFDKEAFVYDKTRNPFDHGCPTNCFNFWCKPRWSSDAKGEF